MTEVERDGKRILVPGTWREPDFKLLPEKLNEARQAIAHQLMPAGDEGVSNVLMVLMLSGMRMPSTDGMEPETAQKFLANQSAEYKRLLRDVPRDVLEKAADECAKSSPFFPAVADLMKFATPEIERRQRQQARIARLIDASKRPTKEPVKVWSGDELTEERKRRLQQIIDIHNRPGGDHGRKAKAERELAALENRAPADWAKPQAITAPPLTVQRSIANPKARTVIDVEEQPPLPDAVPEWSDEP